MEVRRGEGERREEGERGRGYVRRTGKSENIEERQRENEEFSF